MNLRSSRLVGSAVLFAILTLSGRAITSVTINAPASAVASSSYYVSVSASDDFGEAQNLTVTRNGQYWASASYSPWDYGRYTLSVGGYSAAPGSPGTVSFFAAFDTDSTTVYASKSVAITAETTPPSAPDGLASNSVGMGSFNLTWNASSDNVGVTGYEVRRDGTSLGTTSGTSMSIAGLSMNTTYSLDVRATDAAGNWSAWSAPYTVTTAGDTAAPSTPTGLSASGVGMNSFTLSWSASSDNVGVTGYEVMRGSTSLGTTGGTSLGVTGLSPNTTYGMYVRARDGAGNWSSWSAVCNVTTAADTTPPSVPSGLSGSSIAIKSFTLSWTASSDNVGVTAYEVRKGTTSLGTTGTTNLAVTGLAPSTTYAMTVRARDAAGNWSAWSAPTNVTTAADTTAPATPAGLASAGIAATSFTLSWSASTDNVGVTAYEVMKGTTSLGTTTTTSMSVTGLTAGTTYAMKVRARDAAANWSAWSTVLNVTTTSTAPAITSATTWSVPQFATVGPYKITATNAPTSYSLTGTLPTGLSFSATSGQISGQVTQSGTFTVTVGATNSSGTGTRSLTISVLVGALVPAATVSSASGSIAGGYLYVKPGDVVNLNPGGTASLGVSWTEATVWKPDSTPVTFANQVAPNHFKPIAYTTTVAGQHSYVMRLVDTGINFRDQGVIFYVDGAAPAAPGGLVASAVTTTSFTLSWGAATDNYAVTGYEVFRNGTSAGTSSSTSLAVTGLSPNTAYAMTVRARDAAGNWSAPSAAISVTTVNPNADDDNDGMPNTFEQTYFGSPTGGNPALDPDGDGLSNVAEYNLGKNPLVYDAGKSTLGGTIPAGWPNAADGSNGYAVGITAGNLSVDRNGAATYQIPLWVVPGTAGMEPKLSLDYSSQAGAGWLGFGWTLSGLSAISRGPQTKAVDNNVTGVAFTASDRYYLDGQRLVAVAGTDGADGTEYRTEIDSMSKVISHGSAGSGPQWFEVKTKAGLTMEFGHTSDAAAEAQGRSEIRTWAVNKISDTKGNYIEFIYDKNPGSGEQRIARINYTGNSAGLTPYASVRFTYGSRPDTFNGYLAGTRIVRTQRITQISMYFNPAGAETEVRRYTFDYANPELAPGYGGRSFLTALHEMAPADGREYRPLTFEYDESPAGWNQLAASWGPPAVMAEYNAKPKGTGFVDLNGDGRPDFVQYHMSSTGAVLARGAWINDPVSGWLAADGSGGSADFRPPYPLAKDGAEDAGTRFVDLNGDGLTDFIDLNSGFAYLNTPNVGFVYSSQWSFPTPTADEGMYAAARESLHEALGIEDHLTPVTITSVTYSRSLGVFADVNGDGRPDFVGDMGTFYFDGTGGGNATSGAGGLVRPYGIRQGDGWENTGAGWVLAPTYGGQLTAGTGRRLMDVNADGHPDTVQNWYSSGQYHTSVSLGTGSGWVLQSNSSPFTPPVMFNAGSPDSSNAPVGTEALDLNGDGFTDLLSRNDSAGTYLVSAVYYGTGTGWVSGDSAFLPPFELAHDNIPQGVALIDVNSDGIADLVRAWDSSTRDVRLGTGHGWTGPVPSYNLVRQIAQPNRPTTGADFVDLDGDGAVDQVWYWQDTSATARGAALNLAKPAGRLKKVTNGLQVSAQISYAPLTERDGGGFTVYDKGSGGPADSMNVIGPVYVVKAVSDDDGAGGQYVMTYRYGGLRSDRLRGSLGFEWTRVTDSRTGIVSTTTYNQSFPYVGMVASTETRSGGVSLSASSIAYDDRHPSGPAHLPYAAVVVQSSHDLNGSVISGTTTDTAIDDYGNVSSITVDTGDGYAKTTTNTYADNVGAWLLGRLTQSSVVASAAGRPSVTRTSSFTYNGSSGLLETETVEPGDSTLRLTTTYGYDTYGNRTSVAITGAAIGVDAAGTLTAGAAVTRTTVTTYDSLGRFAASTTNALGHTETYGYNAALGCMTSLTGANGLTTAWEYDSFGLRTKETRADGTVTNTRLRWAGAGAPAGAVMFVETESTGAAPSLAFSDPFGRGIWALSINGDGRMVYQRTLYDNMGRAYARSNPYYNDGSTVYWTQTTAYDSLGRPLAVQTPDDENGAQTTSYAYDGRVTSATDPKGRVVRTTLNAQGWTSEVVRNLGGGPNDRAVVTYAYDAVGNLTSTEAAGVGTSFSYDLRGRKTAMTDPDMGAWQYRYNTFGELIWQKDAKGQITTLAYDALGRLASRVEPEGTTAWTYDSSSAGGAWKGKLYAVSSPGGYGETYAYDGYGRPTGVTRTIDGAPYAISQTYDSASRPEKTIYPTAFQTRNVYNAFGYLKEVRRADSGRNDVYWEADGYDVSGRVDSEFYGNGTVNDRIFSPATGRLQGAAVGRGIETGPAFSVQYLGYTHDAVGNILTRNDGPTGRSEVFAYDGLDRLTSQRVNGGTPVTVTYDAMGNITAKSDVGGYTYSGFGPHAVSAVGGGPLGAKTYAYDANGNMVSGGGRTITWMSFNQVASVVQGSFSSTFSFGAGHERVKEVSHLGTTIYVGGIYEKVTNGAAFQHKHYIMAPTGRIAVYTESSGTAPTVRYFHTDGLGSITAVTDEAGRVEKRFAFDAWGRRIDPTTGSAITGTTAAGYSRGFTDHEQLDDLGLVHMNGRVYDPVLGRFLSADPYVQDSSDSQAYNRYSYLTNNPLGGTDPSGFFGLKDVVKIVAIVVVAYFTAGWGVQLAGAMGFTTSVTVAGVTSTTLAGAVAGGIGAGFGSSFAASLLNGGSIGDAFKAGVIGGIAGGVTAGLLHGVGGASWAKGKFGSAGWARKALAHGLIQGGMQEATGGEFRHGFYAGVAVGATEDAIGNWARGNRAKGVTAAAVVGGTASALGGGKFANGAVSGAFSYMFNWASQYGFNVHQMANARALNGIASEWEISVLDEATVDADRDQSSEGAYTHAMRNLDAKQTVAEAQFQTEMYVREQFAKAFDLMDTNYAAALYEFGKALHTIQDGTSPEHYGYQGWKAAWAKGVGKWMRGFPHGFGEKSYPGDYSALRTATRQAWNWFQSKQLPEGNLVGIHGHD